MHPCFHFHRKKTLKKIMIEPDQYSIFEADADSDILGWNISKKLVGYSIYINVTKIRNEVRIDTMLDFER